MKHFIYVVTLMGICLPAYAALVPDEPTREYCYAETAGDNPHIFGGTHLMTGTRDECYAVFRLGALVIEHDPDVSAEQKANYHKEILVWYDRPVNGTSEPCHLVPQKEVFDRLPPNLNFKDPKFDFSDPELLKFLNANLYLHCPTS